MDYACDLYVYESDYGFVIHVAGRRRVWTPPEPRWDIINDTGKVTAEEWQRRHDAYWQALDAAEFEPVNHYLAGQSIENMDSDEAYRVCAGLIKDGLNAPKSLLPDLYMCMIIDYYRLE